MRNILDDAGFTASGGGSRELFVTPRSNPDLPQKLGGFSTLAEGLDYAARGRTGFNFYSPRGRLESVQSYANVRREGLLAARRLLSIGLKRGERVVIVAETGPRFMAVFFGCQYAGFVPCPVPFAMHMGGRKAYVECIAGMMASAHAAAVIAPEELRDAIGESAARAGVGIVLSHDELAGLPAPMCELEPFGPDDAAYIQYSSGSTSCPKGVLVTQASLRANATGILNHGLRISPADRAFSWLPLYHDMGLVGFCLAPMLGQVSVDYLATPSFARRPALWLRLMAQNQCTVCYSPSFGYDLAGRRINGEAVELDLSHWRIAGIGGDMVRADVLETFCENLAAAGFDKSAFLPSYGMAEATLAITFADVGSGFRIDTVDRDAVNVKHHAVPLDDADSGNETRARRFVVCGRPFPDHDVKVCDDLGRSLADRQIGHILVRGDSLMGGYYRDQDATAKIMRKDGFMDTGDMGYMLNGEIVLTGRAKDLILHNGRNIWPQDIEWAVEQVEPLHSGDAAAFAVDGANDEDNVVVLVQCRLRDCDRVETLRRQAAAAVHRASGVECKIVLVAPKSLPFTSSGKLSRAAAKAKFLNGGFEPVGVETIAGSSQPVNVAAAG